MVTEDARILELRRQSQAEQKVLQEARALNLKIEAASQRFKNNPDLFLAVTTPQNQSSPTQN